MTPRKNSRRKTKKPQSISYGRPPPSRKPTSTSISSRATRTVIRKHHQLQKAHAQALSQGKTDDAEHFAAQIEANGGLQTYQEASKTGQSLQRGGDSSTVLVEWLRPVFEKIRATRTRTENGNLIRVLEIGALSTKNAISRLPNADVTRIDLHAQEKGILQQDFMERSLPSNEGERFHIVSLSLVLNYVPDPVGRGEMLRRTTRFLSRETAKDVSNQLPCLFLVLPAACVLNSRYLTEGRLEDILNYLGYTVSAKKVSAKLVYYLLLFRPERVQDGGNKAFKKEELQSGGQRNNFAIVFR